MDSYQTSLLQGASAHCFEPARITGMNRWVWFMAGIWTIAIMLSFFLNGYQIRAHTMDKARSELRTHAFKDVTFRRWASKHDGVYVPVSADTQPNPYLAFLPEREVITPSGRTLTLMNPACMVRQFNEMTNHEYGAQGHLSSLKPINPQNMPDAWESDAIRQFDQAVQEVTEVSNIQGAPYLRLIRPMVMTEQCLNCHNYQSYKPSDIAGVLAYLFL